MLAAIAMSTGNSPCILHSDGDSDYEPTLETRPRPLPPSLAPQCSSDTRFSTGDTPSHPSSPSLAQGRSEDSEDDDYEPGIELDKDGVKVTRNMNLSPPRSPPPAQALSSISQAGREVGSQLIDLLYNPEAQTIKMMPQFARSLQRALAAHDHPTNTEVLLQVARQLPGAAQRNDNAGGPANPAETEAVAETETEARMCGLHIGSPLNEVSWDALTADAVGRMSPMVVRSAILQACGEFIRLRAMHARARSGVLGS